MGGFGGEPCVLSLLALYILGLVLDLSGRPSAEIVPPLSVPLSSERGEAGICWIKAVRDSSEFCFKEERQIWETASRDWEVECLSFAGTSGCSRSRSKLGDFVFMESDFGVASFWNVGLMMSDSTARNSFLAWSSDLVRVRGFLLSGLIVGLDVRFSARLSDEPVPPFRLLGLIAQRLVLSDSFPSMPLRILSFCKFWRSFQCWVRRSTASM